MDPQLMALIQKKMEQPKAESSLQSQIGSLYEQMKQNAQLDQFQKSFMQSMGGLNEEDPFNAQRSIGRKADFGRLFKMGVGSAMSGTIGGLLRGFIPSGFGGLQGLPAIAGGVMLKKFSKGSGFLSLMGDGSIVGGISQMVSGFVPTFGGGGRSALQGIDFG